MLLLSNVNSVLQLTKLKIEPTHITFGQTIVLFILHIGTKHFFFFLSKQFFFFLLGLRLQRGDWWPHSN